VGIHLPGVIPVPVADHLRLVDENRMLKLRIAELEGEKQSLYQRFTEQDTQIKLIQATSARLMKDNADLETEIKALHEENRLLKEKISILTKENMDLKTRLEVVEEKIFTLTLREAMRALETFCVLEILGSKNQMRAKQVYTFKELQILAAKDNQVSQRLKAFTKLSIDDIDNLTYFKKLGDGVAHDKLMQPITKPEELYLPEETEPEFQASKKKLLDLLANYCSDAKVKFGQPPKL